MSDGELGLGKGKKWLDLMTMEESLNFIAVFASVMAQGGVEDEC